MKSPAAKIIFQKKIATSTIHPPIMSNNYDALYQKQTMSYLNSPVACFYEFDLQPFHLKTPQLHI